MFYYDNKASDASTNALDGSPTHSIVWIHCTSSASWWTATIIVSPPSSRPPSSQPMLTVTIVQATRWHCHAGRGGRERWDVGAGHDLRRRRRPPSSSNYWRRPWWWHSPRRRRLLFLNVRCLYHCSIVFRYINTCTYIGVTDTQILCRFSYFAIVCRSRHACRVQIGDKSTRRQHVADMLPTFPAKSSLILASSWLLRCRRRLYCHHRRRRSRHLCHRLHHRRHSWRRPHHPSNAQKNTSA